MLIKNILGNYFTTLKRYITYFDDMFRFLMKNWIGCTYQFLTNGCNT